MFNLLMVAFVLVLLAVPHAIAQDKTPITVKSSEVVTGVVIVHVQQEAKSLDLQCNEGAGNCTALHSGHYLMVQLPEHFGMYECKNVVIYRGDADKPEAAEKVGAYCVIEK